MSGGRAFCDLAIPKGTVGPYPAPRIDMRGGTWTIGALSAGALLMAALAAPAARSQTAALEDFSGAWRLDGTRQVQRMDDAIDRVVDQMNLLIREIARGEIHRRIDPEHRVVIRVDDEQHVRLGYDDWGPSASGSAARPSRPGARTETTSTCRSASSGAGSSPGRTREKAGAPTSSASPPTAAA